MDRAKELAESIIHRFLTLNRYRRHVSGTIHEQWHTSGRELAVIRYLIQEGPRSVSQISRFLYVRDATTSPLLERMEEDGYVTRERCREDKRQVIVQVTAKGRETVTEAPLGPVWLMRTRLPELPIEELDLIDHALARLSELAEVDEEVLK